MHELSTWLLVGVGLFALVYFITAKFKSGDDAEDMVGGALLWIFASICFGTAVGARIIWALIKTLWK